MYQPPQQPGSPGGNGPYGGSPYGAPAYGGTPHRAQPTSGREGSRAGCIVAIVGGVLALLGAIAGFVYFIIHLTAPPRDAGHAFLAKLRHGDYDGAWDSSSSSFKRTIARDELKDQLDSLLPEAAESTDATFSSTSVTNHTAQLEGTLQTSHGSHSISMTLTEEDSTWRVTKIGP